MNDPNVDLDETLADLFGAERRHPGPPRGAQDRIRAAVAASIGAALVTGSGAAAATSVAASSVGSGAVSTSTAAATSGGLATTAATTAATATTATVATSGLAAKLGGGAAIVAAIAGTVGGAVFVHSSELEPIRPATVVVEAVPARPSPPAGLVVFDDVASLLEAPPSKTTTTPKATPRATPAPAAPVIEAVVEAAPNVVVDEPARTAALAAERRQLAMARAALTAGDGRQALALLDGHRVTWPAGQLVEEREALIVLSLAHLGKNADAQAAATAFRAMYPRSLFMFAIDRAVP